MRSAVRTTGALMGVWDVGLPRASGPGLLSEVEQTIRCYRCHHEGTKLIPTDRTMVSFDRMP